MGNASRDDNYVPTLIAVSNADGTTPVTLYADPTTHRLLVSASGVTTSSFDADTLVTEAEGISSNDNDTTIPTSAAVKDYVDGVSGVGGSTGSTDNAILRANGTGGSTVQSSGVIISDNNDITAYDATNDGNPEIRLGAADAEELHIQTVYDTGAQTLDYVLFQTDAASATADKGKYTFNVDGTNILDITDSGIDFLQSGAILDFNAGDVTITHSSNLLQIAGGNLRVPALGVGTTNGGTALIETTEATDTLQGLRIPGDATDALAFSTFVTGDSFVRFVFLSTGQMTWGDGSGAGDTNLYRNAANELKTDDSFTLGGTLTVGSLTGVLRADSGIVSVDSDVTDIVSAASTTAAGKIEIAIASEVNTGTDATRAVSPDSLAGSNFGIRYLQFVVFDFGTSTATGDGKYYAHIPAGLNGMNLVEVHAKVITAPTGSAETYQVHNVTQAADMLSTAITIDATETGSDTAATPAVIDTANDDVATNDVIRIDVDAVGSSTAAQGLIITLGFQLP